LHFCKNNRTTGVGHLRKIMENKKPEAVPRDPLKPPLKVINVMIELELYQQLRLRAIREGSTLRALSRKALVRFLQRSPIPRPRGVSDDD
jgi:hypothetical protein